MANPRALTSADHGNLGFDHALTGGSRSHAGWPPTSPSPRIPPANLKPAKDKSIERIDSIIALIMAIGRAIVAQEEPEPVYSLFFV